MLFMAVLKHSPEHCLMRPENAEAREELRKRFLRREELQKETGVKVLGAYVNPNEHTFYWIIETDDYRNVSRYLGPPLLTYHSAKITPVIKVEDAMRPS
jgi:hypothetical protein